MLSVHQLLVLQATLLGVEVPRTCRAFLRLTGGYFLLVSLALRIVDSERLYAIVTDALAVSVTHADVTRLTAVAPR